MRFVYKWRHVCFDQFFEYYKYALKYFMFKL